MWTTEEEDILKLLGFFSYCGKYASKGDIKFDKTMNGNKPWYEVGISGIGVDVDGDAGFCRTWRSFITFNDAVDYIKTK